MTFFDTILNLELQLIFGVAIGVMIFIGLIIFTLNNYWYYRLLIYFRDNRKDVANKLGIENKNNLQILLPHKKFASTRIDEKLRLFPPLIKVEEIEKMCVDDKKMSELYSKIRSTRHMYHYFIIWFIFMIVLFFLTLLIKTGSVLVFLFLRFINTFKRVNEEVNSILKY